MFGIDIDMDIDIDIDMGIDIAEARIRTQVPLTSAGSKGYVYTVPGYA